MHEVKSWLKFIVNLIKTFFFFPQDMIDDMWDELENKDQWATFQNQQATQMQAFC